MDLLRMQARRELLETVVAMKKADAEGRFAEFIEAQVEADGQAARDDE